MARLVSTEQETAVTDQPKTYARSFEHECPDWDYLRITLNDAEAVGCSCYCDIPEAAALYEKVARDLDAHNEATGSPTRADHILRDKAYRR